MGMRESLRCRAVLLFACLIPIITLTVKRRAGVRKTCYKRSRAYEARRSAVVPEVTGLTLGLSTVSKLH